MLTKIVILAVSLVLAIIFWIIARYCEKYGGSNSALLFAGLAGGSLSFSVIAIISIVASQ